MENSWWSCSLSPPQSRPQPLRTQSACPPFWSASPPVFLIGKPLSCPLHILPTPFGYFLRRAAPPGGPRRSLPTPPYGPRRPPAPNPAVVHAPDGSPQPCQAASWGALTGRRRNHRELRSLPSAQFSLSCALISQRCHWRCSPPPRALKCRATTTTRSWTTTMARRRRRSPSWWPGLGRTLAEIRPLQQLAGGKAANSMQRIPAVHPGCSWRNIQICVDRVDLSLFLFPNLAKKKCA